MMCALDFNRSLQRLSLVCWDLENKAGIYDRGTDMEGQRQVLNF